LWWDRKIIGTGLITGVKQFFENGHACFVNFTSQGSKMHLLVRSKKLHLCVVMHIEGFFTLISSLVRNPNMRHAEFSRATPVVPFEKNQGFSRKTE